MHQHNVNDDIFWAGPNMTILPSYYGATLFLKIPPSPEGTDEKISTYDIAANAEKNVLNEYDVFSSDFESKREMLTWHKFTLQFTAEDSLKYLEFRGINRSSKYDIYPAYSS